MLVIYVGVLYLLYTSGITKNLAQNMYTYCFYGKSNNAVELLITTPNYQTSTELTLSPDKTEGHVDTYYLGTQVKIYVLKNDNCWMFGVGQVIEGRGIPGNWMIDIQQHHTSKMQSTKLRVRSSTPIIIRRHDKQKNSDLSEIQRLQRSSSTL